MIYVDLLCIDGAETKSTLTTYFSLSRIESSPYINRFLQPDTLIPGPENPQSWNRYSYVRNNPILYNDPSGHDSIISQFLAGFTAEVTSSVLWFSPKVQQDLAPNEHESTAMLAGRVVGDVVSTLAGVALMGTGGGAMTGGTLCVGLTGGGCLPAGAPTAVAGGALILEGAGMSVRGAVGLGSNLVLMAQTEEHHIATNKNSKRGPQWTEKFKNDIFDKAGMDLEDPANKVNLPNHQGPHPQSYHQWIYDRLSRVIEGVNGRSKVYNSLKSELRKIAGELLDDPSLLNGPK